MAQASINSGILATQIERQNSQADEIINAITQSNQEIQSLGNVRAEAIIRGAEAESTVATAAAIGKLRAQESSLKAATVIGTNLDDASELITSLGLESRDAFNKAAVARDEYFKKTNINFFDSPVEYIANVVLGGADQAASTYSREAMRYNATNARLTEIANQTTAHATAQAAIAQTITAGSIEALQTQLAQKAVGEAAQVKQQNMQFNIQGLKEVFQMNSAKLDNYFKLNSAVMSEKHLAIAQQSLAMQAKSHALALEERTTRIEEKKATREEIETLGATINKGRASMGLPEIPVGRSVQMMKMGGEAGEAIKYQYTVGATAEVTGKPIIADNPGKAARVINSTSAPLSPAAKPIKELLLSSLGEVITSKKLTIDKKNPLEVDKATSDLVKQITTTMAKNIKTDDATNIYQAPDIATIAKIPAVADTALYKKVLAPAIESGAMVQTNPGILVNQTINALQTKQITFNEAVDGLTKIFKGAVAVNNENKDFIRYGVTPQTTYRTTLPTTPQNNWQANVTIDLTTTAGVSNVLSARMAKNRLLGGAP